MKENKSHKDRKNPTDAEVEEQQAQDQVQVLYCILLFIYSHQMDTWIELYFITMNA